MKRFLCLILLLTATVSAQQNWQTVSQTVGIYGSVNNDWNLAGPPAGFRRVYSHVWISRNVWSPGDVLELSVRRGNDKYRISSSLAYNSPLPEHVIGGASGLGPITLYPNEILQISVRRVAGPNGTLTVDHTSYDVQN